MDFTSLVLGADLSHYQGSPDFGQLEADGVQFVILKATQGMGSDPMFETNRKAAADKGILTFAYPFLTPGDTDAMVANCLTVSDGMVLCLDWEETGIDDAVVQRWIAAFEDKYNREGMVYHGIYPVDTLTPIISSWPWWLARYNTAPGIPAWDGKPIPDWSKEWLVWQYTGNGRAPGVTTAIDLDRLACPLPVLQAWHDTGTFPAWGVGIPTASA